MSTALDRSQLVAPADQPARATRLGGKWLLIARAGWIVLVGLTLWLALPRTCHGWRRIDVSLAAVMAVQLATDQARPGRCCTMDYAAEPLKRPNQTMAGSWVGLHDCPAYPAFGREAASSMAAAGPFRS